METHGMHDFLILQDLTTLCRGIDLSHISCLYCRKDIPNGDLITCRTCPCAFHQACYEGKVNDKVRACVWVQPRRINAVGMMKTRMWCCCNEQWYKPNTLFFDTAAALRAPSTAHRRHTGANLVTTTTTAAAAAAAIKTVMAVKVTEYASQCATP
jgi:hypothetical protein